ADALASLEYYLEALRDQRGNRDEILDIARNSLEALGYWPLPEPVQAPAAAPPPATVSAGVAPAVPATQAGDAAGPVAPAATGVPVGGDDEPAAAVEAPAIAQAPATAAPSHEAEPAPAPVPAAPAGPVVGGFETVGEEIDEEIREVFLEEFAEEIDNLDSLLPHWRTKPDDMERLRPIRRVFHTLKGSGRLVGARMLGEFSWKIENMLNRVLDGSRPPSEAVIAMVDRAFYTLPELQAALRGERGLATDLAPREEAADRIAGGEDIMPPEPVALADAPAAMAGDAPVQGEPVPLAEAGEPLDAVPAKIDPLLLEILDAEVNGHLQTVDAWVAAARAGDAAGSDPLLRALHTAEHDARRVLAAGASASPEGVEAIADLAAVVRATVETLKQPSPLLASQDALAQRLGALRDSLPEVSSGLAALVDAEAMEGAPAIPEAQPPESGVPALVAIDMGGYADLAGTAIGPDAGADDAGGEPAQVEAGAGEAERLEAERLEAERLEAERLEAERLEAERLEAERLEAERLEAERLEAERLEAEGLEAERREAERHEAERLEAERLEAERLEAERLEAERLEAERLEAERLEAERLEAERLEAERLEAERLEAERLEAERLEAERLEAERLEA